MATYTNPDFRILIGNQGDFSIDVPGSGKLIRDQIESYIQQIQQKVKLLLPIDSGDVQKQVKDAVEKMAPAKINVALAQSNIQINIDVAHLQQQVKDAIENMPAVKIKVKPDPSGGGGGGGKGGTSELQKLGSMVSDMYRKKAKLLDLSTSTKEAQTLNRQIDQLKANIASTKASYQGNSGKTQQQINAEVLALNSVTKSMGAYAQKVSKVNDTYDKQVKKIADLKHQLETAFGTQKDAFSKNGANQQIKDQFAQYEKLYLSVQQRAKNILKGTFDASDPATQAQEIRELLSLYGQLEKMIAGVATAQTSAQTKSESASLAMKKVATRAYEFYQQIKDTAPYDFQKRVLGIFNEASSGKSQQTAKKLTIDLEKLKNEAYASKYAVESFGQTIARVFKQKVGYGVMAAAAMKARQALRLLYTNVVEMDAAMTQLRIVTNETDSAYTRFAVNASKAAKSIGSSVTDIMKSAETYARLGYTLDESLNLSKTTAQLANVAATDADTATTFMTAILKGFNKDAASAENIGDMLTLVGKKYAISAEELGAALERGGASMAAANNTLEESIALLAAGNAAVQNAETVGTAFKTVTMRIRGSSAEDLEEAGLATDGLCESTSKLRKEIKALSGVDIMLNEDTYKSTYQILLEISQVWDRLTDVNRATLLETLAGKRNSQVLMSVIQNVDDLKGAYEDAQNASGTMAKATATYLDSIGGKVSKLSASYQELSSRILDSSVIKMFLDAGIGLTNMLNDIDEASNGAVSGMLSLAAAATTAFVAVEALMKVITLGSVKAWFADIAAGISLLKGALAAGSLPMIIQALSTIPGLAVAAGVAIAGIGYYAYKAYKEAHPSFEDMKADLQNLRDEADETKRALQENASRIAELQKLSAEGTITLVEQDELNKLLQANELLKQQYEIKQTLIEQQEADVQAEARRKAKKLLEVKKTTYQDAAKYDDYSTFADFQDVENGKDYSLGDKIGGELQRYQDAAKQIATEYANAKREGREFNQSIIDQQKEIRSSAAKALEGYVDTIADLINNLDSKEDAALINELQLLMDKIQIGIGNANTGGQIAERMINSDYYSTAKAQLKELADAGNLTKFSLAKLRGESPIVRELIDNLSELGIFDWDNAEASVAALANQVRTVGEAGLDASASLTGVAADLKAMTEKYDLLYEAQENLNKTGAISSTTLSEIAEKYPELESNIGLYIAGMKTGKELLADLNNAYQDDVDAYKQALAEKLARSPEFYNSLQENEKKHINDLADGYGVDLKNFKDLETAKLQFQAEIIKKLAANSARFHGSTLEEMKAYQASVQSNLKYATDPRQKAYLASELQNVTNSLAAIENFKKEMDAIALNGVVYDPEKYSPAKIKDDSKSGTDEYKQAIEKEIKILQHEREMDKISAEEYYDRLAEIEKKYYVDKEKYAEEIADLDQQIFNGRRDILSDWISDQERIADALQSSGASISRSNASFGASLDDLRKKVNDYAAAWNKMNNGNVDYRKRNVFTGADLIKAGWNSAKDIENLSGANGVTTYTQGFYGKDFNESSHKNNLKKYIEITPILDDGTILSPSALEAYVEKIFKSADVLSADKVENGGKGLIVSMWDNPSKQELNQYFDDLQGIKDAHLKAYYDLQNQIKSSSVTTAEDVYRSILARIEKAIDEAIAYGLDENSEYVQELRDQYKKTCQDILNMVQGAYDDFISYADDFNLWDNLEFSKLDVLEHNLKTINQLYKDGLIAASDYVEAHNQILKQIYDTRQDSIKTIIDLTMDMIKQEAEDEIEALDLQKEKIAEIIDLRKKMLQNQDNEKKHQRQVDDAAAEIADLQSQIALLSLDNSREAIAKRTELEKKLAEKQRDLADLQADYALDKTLETLDETQDAKEDEIEKEEKKIKESVDTWAKVYALAIDRINNDWEGLYADLQVYMEKYRTSIDGPDSLATAFTTVNNLIKEMGINLNNLDIEDLYNSVGIDPGQSFLNMMQQNSELAQKNGSRYYEGRDLHKENEKLAARYELATGVKLTYDPNRGWLRPDGTPAYQVNASTSTGSSSSSNTQTNSFPNNSTSNQPSSSSQNGPAYTATYSQYGKEPEKNLRNGDSGEGVKWLQYYLKQQDLFPYAVDGVFYTRTEDALKAFQRKAGIDDDGVYGPETRSKLKKYHSGGIVDGAGALNDKEVLAILQKGELVLDDTKKSNLRSLLESVKSTISAMAHIASIPYPNRVASIGASGNTFAPNITVSISHNGKMSDADADKYGKRIGDAALETMYKTMRARGIKG